MPTYTYKREDGSLFDIQQSMADDALTVCPTTGQPVERAMQAFGSGLMPKRFHKEGHAMGKTVSKSPRGANYRG